MYDNYELIKVFPQLYVRDIIEYDNYILIKVFPQLYVRDII
jgi:hypothetical protein